MCACVLCYILLYCIACVCVCVCTCMCVCMCICMCVCVQAGACALRFAYLQVSITWNLCTVPVAYIKFYRIFKICLCCVLIESTNKFQLDYFSNRYTSVLLSLTERNRTICLWCSYLTMATHRCLSLKCAYVMQLPNMGKATILFSILTINLNWVNATKITVGLSNFDPSSQEMCILYLVLLTNAGVYC